MLLELPKEIGRYTLVRHIASGGMADVYLARSGGAEGFGRRCVVKRIKPELTAEPRFRERFIGEARIAAGLLHPNIISVFDLLENRGDLYLVMEHIDGGTLSELRSKLPGCVLPPWAVARIGWCVARALERAHPEVVHRDISPQNVLVGRHGEVKLIDFGIARPTNAAGSTGLVGKVAYLAPEQARGGAIEPRTDLFGLGVMLFELLTGERPYRGGTDLEALEELKTGSSPPAMAREMRADVPAALSDLIDEAVQRRPEDRPASARAMAEALEAMLASELAHAANQLERLVQSALGPPQPSGRTVERAAEKPPPTAVMLPPTGERQLASPLLGALGAVALVLAIVGAHSYVDTWPGFPTPKPRPAMTAPPPSLQDAPGEHAATAPPLTAPRTVAPAATSAVRLVADPFASVTVDGKSVVDADPFVDVTLTRGRHRAVFRHGSEERVKDFVVGSEANQRVEVAFTAP